MDSNVIKNRSGDQKYFVMTPELVRAMCDVYEQSLWGTIKMICGPDGNCDASISLLAALSKMSVGKVFAVRKSLLDKGLLEGGPIDPNNNQSRWILTVPDIWEENMKVRKAMGDSLHARAMAYNKLQQSNLIEIRENVNGSREDFFSWSEKLIAENLSPHEKNLSPHEKNLSPHEKLVKTSKHSIDKELDGKLQVKSFSPHETKYNIKLKPRKKNENREIPTLSEQRFWEMLPLVKSWWDKKAIPAFQNKYKWNPGDLCTGPELEQLLKHAQKFGMEVLNAKYEDYLRQDNKFFTKNNHPISLFVKCIAQFSGEQKETSTLEDENARQYRDYMAIVESRNNGYGKQRQAA